MTPSDRTRLRRGAILLAALLTGVGILLPAGLTCRPSWYSTPQIDHNRLEEDKRALAALVDGISAELNAGRTVRVTLMQDQLNRWLTARREIWDVWPGVPARSLDLLLDPVVLIESGGRLRIAGLADWRGWRVPLAFAATLAASDGYMRVEKYDAKAGLWPIPRQWIPRQLIAASRGAASQSDSGAILVENEFTWPNGKVRYRVVEMRTETGAMFITLQPLNRERRR